MLKVGLVGVGGISGAHIPAWESLEDVQLTALCDIRPERMENWPEKRRYTDFDRMLDGEELDILDICLPTWLHVPFAVKAMERGIHVICEKPVSLNPEELALAYSVARKNGVCFMVAQVLRFWPEYELLKQIIDSQTYGKLLSGYMGRLGCYPRWSWDNWMMDPARSGMVPFDLHIHDLDFLVYSLGVPKHAVRHRASLPDQDYVHAVYEYPGFFVSTEASWYAAPYPFGASFRFQFERAVAAYEKGVLTIYQNDDKVLTSSGGQAGDSGVINLPKSDAYAEEIRYFKDCVLAGTFPDKVKEEELSAVLELLRAF